MVTLDTLKVCTGAMSFYSGEHVHGSTSSGLTSYMNDVIFGYQRYALKSVGVIFDGFLERFLTVFWKDFWRVFGKIFDGFLERFLMVFWKDFWWFFGKIFDGFLERFLTVFWKAPWLRSLHLEAGYPLCCFLIQYPQPKITPGKNRPSNVG